jgi:hypothetical protein
MRRIWFVLSFVLVSFLWADHAFAQTGTSTFITCFYPSYPEGKYPDCYCAFPPPKCGACEIQIGHECVPVLCPPPGLTRTVPERRYVNRPVQPRLQRSMDPICVGECTSYCSPAADCRGLVGSALVSAFGNVELNVGRAALGSDDSGGDQLLTFMKTAAPRPAGPPAAARETARATRPRLRTPRSRRPPRRQRRRSSLPSRRRGTSRADPSSR